MSDMNHIDDLFKSKLGGREIEYSAAAWAGAEGMLDKHYRWMAIKKWLLVLIPLVLISGGGLFWMLDDTGDAVTQYEERIQKTVRADMKPAESTAPAIVTTNTATQPTQAEASGGQAAPADVASATDGAAPIKTTSMVRQPNLNMEPQPPTTTASAVHQDEDMGMDDEIAVTAQPTDEEEDFDWHSPAIQHVTTNEIPSRDNKFMIDVMPVFSVRKVSLDCYYDPAATDVNIPAPVLNKLRKVQFTTDAGLIVAQGFKNRSDQRQAVAFGGYAGLGIEYHQSATVLLRGDVGIFSRSGLSADQTYSVGGDQLTVKPLAANYLNVGLGVGIRPHIRHTFGFGMQFAYLMAVANMEERSSGDRVDRTFPTFDNTGFTRTDFAPYARYEVAVAPRVDVSAMLYFGIPDVTESLGGRFPSDDPNRMLRLGVTYRLR